MELRRKEHKDRFHINTRPILTLLIGLGIFTLIMTSAMLSASSNIKPKSEKSKITEQSNDTQNEALGFSDVGILAIVKNIDTLNKQITLYAVDQQEEELLTYNGGTNVKDKYGLVISLTQIPIGTMVDATYQKDKNKLTDLNISNKAWEYVGVNNLNINPDDNVMKIATTKYKYTNDVLILDGNKFITVDNLAEQDELTVRGYEETIWSITVTRGHGTVILEDYDKFLGANITVGYESIQQITEDMEITVREGDFNLTVENGKFSATKNISVYRNQVSYVSLSDLGPGGVQQYGSVTFEISPFGADLFIDGELTSYANPIELTYGKHTITVSLGGYTPYEGVLDLDSTGKSVKISLPEVSSRDTAEVTETDTIVTPTGPNNNPDTSSNIGTDNSSGTDNTNTGDTSDEIGTDNEPNPDDGEENNNDSSEEDEIVDNQHLIYVQNPTGASVYLDGDFMGISPCSFKKVIGTRVLTFIKEGYETMSYTVEVPNDRLDAYFTFPNLSLYDLD